jgi:NADPH:quinone reductase-like Zn-dependent oxidoreductase
MSQPTFCRWVLESQNGIDSLKWEHNAVTKELGEHEVLVELHAASLNYRDLVIAKVSFMEYISIRSK